MIFSAIHMFIRMFREKNPDYTDIGLGFIVMAMIETFLWLIPVAVVVNILG